MAFLIWQWVTLLLPTAPTTSYVYKVSILLGKGDGTFTPQSDFCSWQNYQVDHLRDFDGDGIPDLAALNVGDSTVTIALGNGDGHFPLRGRLHWMDWLPQFLRRNDSVVSGKCRLQTTTAYLIWP